jgi:predicted esterase
MRAARAFCANNNIALSGQVFLSGYSQGGNATMGTAKLIQEEYANEFNVTAACAGGGSFDLS